MKVIERYILRRVFVVFAGALFWTLAIVWTTQVLARIDLVTDSGQTALTFFEIATLMLPSIIPMVIPFALIIGIAQTLGTMNTDSELVVMSAAGTPRMSTITPIILLALIASLASFVVDNGIDPYARERSRQKIAAARADLLSLVIQEGTFRKIEDGLFVQIGQRLPDGNLGQIFVADSRETNVDLAYYAKSGSMLEQNGKSMLMMFDGVINRKTPDGDVSVIHFTSYAFDLAQFANASGQVVMYPKDRTISYLLNPDPNDRIFKRHPQYFRAELHRRFTEWIFPLVFALIAIAVVGDAKSHREARIHPLITAVSIALFWRWLGFFSVDRLQNTPWFVWLVYAVPIAPSLISIWFIVRGRTLELPLVWVERSAAIFRRLAASIRYRWRKLLGHNTAAGRPA